MADRELPGSLPRAYQERRRSRGRFDINKKIFFSLFSFPLLFTPSTQRLRLKTRKSRSVVARELCEQINQKR